MPHAPHTHWSAHVLNNRIEEQQCARNEVNKKMQQAITTLDTHSSNTSYNLSDASLSIKGNQSMAHATFPLNHTQRPTIDTATSNYCIFYFPVCVFFSLSPSTNALSECCCFSSSFYLYARHNFCFFPCSFWIHFHLFLWFHFFSISFLNDSFFVVFVAVMHHFFFINFFCALSMWHTNKIPEVKWNQKNGDVYDEDKTQKSK